MAKPLHIWSTEESAYLRDIFSSGNHEFLAAEINKKFGISVSRNSVIGRCQRLGLYKISSEDFERARRSGHLPRKSGKKPDAARKRVVRARQARRKEILGSERFLITKDGSSGRSLIKFFDDYAGPDHLGIPFHDLNATHCRFPKGEGLAATYCGQPVLEGKSYCARCQSICYSPPDRREQKAAA